MVRILINVIKLASLTRKFLETEGNWLQNISLLIQYIRMEKITMDYSQPTYSKTTGLNESVT